MSYKLGIIGVGKMGSALLNGIMSSKILKKEEVFLGLYDEEGVRIYGKEQKYNYSLSAKEVFSSSEAVILAIKPQSFPEITPVADETDFTGKCIISIAAGISIDYLKTHFKNADIIRCMPNTPALIKMGVTALANSASKKWVDFAKEIFSSVGKVYEIDESLMDLTVPLNGSMPAYLYYFAQSFIDSAVKSGVPYETAKALTVESIISSANMILKSDDDIETLIKNVCSKGGTTIAGLDKLKEGNFSEAIENCYKACAKRSKELCK